MLTLLQSAPAAIPIVEPGRDFSTPDAAVEAVFAAAKSRDRVALRTVFGLAADDLVAADQVQASNELAAFSVACEIGHRLVRESDARCVLEVGPDAWPFPIPIVSSCAIDVAVQAETVMARLTLQSCGVFVAKSFGFLGLRDRIYRHVSDY